MDNKFVNRIEELARLNSVSSGLIAVYGRRRVGKSALIAEWFKGIPAAVISQAIEAAPPLQLTQLFEDFQELLQTELRPQTWEQLFELFDRHPGPINICIDEFPYLVAADSSVPSRFQRWLDRTEKRDLRLVLAGSSMRMMNSSLLSEDSPLYGRAQEILNIRPMTYYDFCQFLEEPTHNRSAFLRYSLLGGVPKYWQLSNTGEQARDLASRLFFISGAYMSREPFRVLRDEKIEGLSPVSVLEAIGRGVQRSSEIAARMGVSQGSISKVLHALMEASVIVRKYRFGDSEKTSKTVLYDIVDPTIRFWFSVYSPHRSRWASYKDEMQSQLLAEHTSRVFESEFANRYPLARSYWEKNIEIDLVRPVQSEGEGKEVVVTELKWRKLDSRERARIRDKLIQKWHCTKISQKFNAVEFEVVTFEDFI